MTDALRMRIPLYGIVELPEYIETIIEEPCIRRLRLIKQLGLKSFTKYSSANHTRFEHSIGAMYLAIKLLNRLIDSAPPNLRTESALLKAYEHEIITAAFLHDIGHGPFSHVMDNILKMRLNIKH